MTGLYYIEQIRRYTQYNMYYNKIIKFYFNTFIMFSISVFLLKQKNIHKLDKLDLKRVKTQYTNETWYYFENSNDYIEVAYKQNLIKLSFSYLMFN